MIRAKYDSRKCVKHP